MKKVLIATTNKDKFSVVSKIFKSTIFPEDEFEIICQSPEMNIPDSKIEASTTEMN